LSVSVTNGTTPQSGVTLTFTSSVAGNFTAPVMTGPGLYSSNFTGSSVTTLTMTTIRVVATKPGYLTGLAQTIITLQPPPSLIVSVTMQPASVSPGTDAGVKVGITNGTRGVPGATIVLWSSGGGSFSGITDVGDGNYTAVFSTPFQTANPTIFANASKTGYMPGKGSATLSIAGLPNPVTAKVFGIPFFVYLAAGLGVIFLVFFLVFKRKADGPKTGPKPVIAPPVYAVRRSRFLGFC